MDKGDDDDGHHRPLLVLVTQPTPTPCLAFRHPTTPHTPAARTRLNWTGTDHTTLAQPPTAREPSQTSSSFFLFHLSPSSNCFEQVEKSPVSQQDPIRRSIAIPSTSNSYAIRGLEAFLTPSCPYSRPSVLTASSLNPSLPQLLGVPLYDQRQSPTTTLPLDPQSSLPFSSPRFSP